MDRRAFIHALGFGTAGLVLADRLRPAAAGPAPARQRPNVVLIVTDDQGYGDLACHGNPVLKTPNLDRLHSRSVRLTDFHVAPMCTPTRGQLLTGRDAMANGATFVCLGRSMMRRGLPTLAEAFKAGGYRTALFGKWHLGDSYPHRPMDRGFDTVVRHGAWGITSIPDYFGNDYFDDTYRHNGRHEQYDGYCTDVWFTEAMQWMKARHRAGDPFFCYVPTNVPHVPHWVADRYAEPYRGKGPEKFFGMIANLDENVGRLAQFLDEQDLARNTLLVFMTDNGTAAGEKVYNAGMRGKKRSYYDGGHRVPCFIRWPAGRIGPPRDIEHLAHVQDILPTLLDLCGLKTPDGADCDGVSLAPLLRGDADRLPDRMLVVQYGDKPKARDAAVLWNKWRLVKGTELYRIDDDPGQKHDIASKHPQIVRRMREHYERWWNKVQPCFQQTRWIDLGAEQANPMMLYSSDWRGSYADNWGNLARGDRIGQWDVRVTRPGRYAFTLYRWPPEARAAMDAPLSGPYGKGRAVPVRQARLQIGGFDQTIPASSGTPSVRFALELDSGDYELRTWLSSASGRALCSAYYVRVERLQAVS